MIMQIGEKIEPRYKDLLKNLATRINFTNVTDQDQFVCYNLFDVEKPETYAYIEQSSNATK